MRADPLAQRGGHVTLKQPNSPAMARRNDLFAAANILRHMMCELHSLRVATASPVLAMAIDANELREQLQELFETIRELCREAEPRCARELADKALDLIKRLAEELDWLACEAERHYGNVPPGCDRADMAN
jgi:hypothetical protein